VPQRFRSRACLALAILAGVVALLSCGGLFLLVRPQNAPDVVTELKALPLYPNARAVVFGDPWATTAGSQGEATGCPYIVHSYSELSFEVQAETRMVLDFYTREFSKGGWVCGPAGGSGTSIDTTAYCTKSDEGPPWPRFTGFDGPDTAPPWIELKRTLNFRHADISAFKSSQGAQTTSATVFYEYKCLH
jgi:hypothetical protein